MGTITMLWLKNFYKDSQEHFQSSPLTLPEETIEDVKSYLKSTGSENTNTITEDPHFYTQFLTEEQQSSYLPELNAFEGEGASTDEKPRNWYRRQNPLKLYQFQLCSKCKRA